jgi:hypothetical protein
LILSLLKGILVIFGGSWVLFEARSWGEVGGLLPTSSIYKPKVLEAIKGDSDQENDDKLLRQRNFNAGKPLRRATL